MNNINRIRSRRCFCSAEPRKSEATAKADTRRMEREDGQYRKLIDSIGNVAQTVEHAGAFARDKKLVECHPFLTGLLGHLIVRKIFGK